MKYEKKNRKFEGKHDYSGSCAPDGPEYYSNQKIFSVGVFQWLPKANGKGLKKSAVKFRVKGYSSQPEKVYDLAEMICDKYDKGLAWWTEKTTTVKLRG